MTCAIRHDCGPGFKCLVGVLGLTLIFCQVSRADDWPQWLGPKHDSIWRETGIIEKFPAGGPQILWRKPIGGGYTGPAVANGRVYVLDRQLAKKDEGAAKPQPGVKKPAGIPGSERILCLSAAEGT